MEKEMYVLYTFANGLKPTGIIADSEEKIINYLNKKYLHTDTLTDGSINIYPCWNHNAFRIKKEKIIIL